MLHLTTIKQRSAPLQGEEACLISIRVSIPLRGLVAHRHGAITIYPFSWVARHSRIISKEGLRGRHLSIPLTMLIMLTCPLILLTLAVEVRDHCTPVITYVDALLCYTYLYTLHIKLPMANIPDNPRQSLAPANFHPAQNSHQGHQEMTSLPQMAQSPGACAFQPSFQATIPSQQFPPKVGTCRVCQRSRVHGRPISACSRIFQNCRPLQPNHHLPPLWCSMKTRPPPILLPRTKRQDRRGPYH